MHEATRSCPCNRGPEADHRDCDWLYGESIKLGVADCFPSRDVNDCPVCGDGSGFGPCSEECQRALDRDDARGRIRGWYAHAKHCVTWARRYQAEGDPDYTPRIADCLKEIRKCRVEVRDIRSRLAAVS